MVEEIQKKVNNTMILGEFKELIGNLPVEYLNKDVLDCEFCMTDKVYSIVCREKSTYTQDVFQKLMEDSGWFKA